MNFDQFISIITAFGFGSILTLSIEYYLRYRDKKISKINQERRKIYKKFISVIIDIFSNSKFQDKSKQLKGDNFLNEIYTFYKDYMLYASPEVINSVSDYMQFLFKNQGKEKMDTRQQFLLLANIIKQMRKEIGLSNKNLGQHAENTFRALLIDFDAIIRKKS